MIEYERVSHELTSRTARVVRTSTPVPGMTRITLAGPELAGFSATGPADHIKLFLPATDLFEAARRDFTPLAHRLVDGGGELDIDVVLHGENGPASAWALHAQVGDEVRVGGPRGSRTATGVETLILVVDESAFPAAARWMNAVGPLADITLIATSSLPANEYFAADPRVRLEQCSPGVDPILALRALRPFDEGTLIFLAGEAGQLVPVRRYLRHEVGLASNQLIASGYWRHGVAGLDHHAAIDPNDPD